MGDFILWEPTGDTAEGDSTLGSFSMGTAFDRMVVERAADGTWLGTLYVVGAPRDELGSFEFDLFPDDDQDYYVMVNQLEHNSEDDAILWCEFSDAARFAKQQADDDLPDEWEDFE